MDDNKFCRNCDHALLPIENRICTPCLLKHGSKESLMEYKGELGHVLPKNDGPGVTVHHVVTELTKELPNMEELFVITKDKDGNWLVSASGSTSGIAMSIQLLQDYWREHS